MEGRSIDEIARLHHVAKGTLYKRMRRLGMILRTRKQSGQLRRRKTLERERLKLRKVIEGWLLNPEDVLLSDTEIDRTLDRLESITEALKAPVGPSVVQAGPVVKSTQEEIA